MLEKLKQFFHRANSNDISASLHFKNMEEFLHFVKEFNVEELREIPSNGESFYVADGRFGNIRFTIYSPHFSSSPTKITLSVRVIPEVSRVY